MTGEITLRGKVLPIGGLKEKVLAAYRFGTKTIVLPRENERDLAEIPDDIRKAMTFHLVKDMDQVLEIALAGPIRASQLPEAEAGGEETRPSGGPVTH